MDEGFNVDVWMPLTIGDFLKRTGHLSATETGAYLLLCCHAWTHDGYVPNDAGRLARIARVTPSEWARVRGAVLALFVLDGARGFRDPKLAEALEAATLLRAKKSEGGRRGAARRWSPGETPSDLFDGTAIGTPIGTVNGISPSPSSGAQGRGHRRAARRPLPPSFGISERVRVWSTERGYPVEHLEVHLAAFRTKAAMHGYIYADWDAAFMEAIREDWAGARVDGSGSVVGLHGSAPARSGAPWWGSEGRTIAEGARLGLSPRPGESLVRFQDRIREAQGKRGVG